MKGFYINRGGRECRFTDRILSGEKTVETRTRRTLDRLCGETVAIIETGAGKAKIVGYALLYGGTELNNDTHPEAVNSAAWAALRGLHCIPAGSKYDRKPGQRKVLYDLAMVERCDPYPVPAGAVRHGRIWCEW